MSETAKGFALDLFRRIVNSRSCRTDEGKRRKYETLRVPRTQEAKREPGEFVRGESTVSVRPDTATNPHEHFEELAALELIGELSAQEYRELHAHLKTCQSCRREYTGLEGVLSHKLPLLHEQQSILALARLGDVLEELSSGKSVLRPTNDLQFLSQSHRGLSPKNLPLRSRAGARGCRHSVQPGVRPARSALSSARRRHWPA